MKVNRWACHSSSGPLRGLGSALWSVDFPEALICSLITLKPWAMFVCLLSVCMCACVCTFAWGFILLAYRMHQQWKWKIKQTLNFAIHPKNLSKQVFVVSCPKCQVEPWAEPSKSVDDIDSDQWGMGSLVERKVIQRQPLISARTLGVRGHAHNQNTGGQESRP